MPQSAFIVRPFGKKPYYYPARAGAQIDRLLEEQDRFNLPFDCRLLTRPDGAAAGEVEVDFDRIEHCLIQPALGAARLLGETTSAVVEAGNIREDMFNRLITADMVIADVSLPNPNVYYELGLRQAFRDKFTFLVRCELSAFPFDLQTDRYFPYDLLDLIRRPEVVRQALAAALRKTLNQYRADSPVFKLMPQLEAEDRSRFLAVPEDFREEVERARRQRQREYLSLMALECESHLWEIEGLRVVGRAQFEANFIEGAKDTWQRIAARYPDDAEANTVLSTVYQRLQDRTRSEQALARVTRSRTLSPQRMSELRALNGRNLKAEWTNYWRGTDNRRLAALTSPLLQRAIDAYTDAFKTDLNNSYAGLNALTLQVIQAELIDGQRDEWRSLQHDAGDDDRAFQERVRRIDQLASALLLALEADRERLVNRGQGDPWFAMLEAGVMCTISRQPEYVAQLYAEASYNAPPKSDAGMIAALEMYQALQITGTFKGRPRPEMVGTLGDNVAAALKALRLEIDKPDARAQPRKLLVFVGLRADDVVKVSTRFDARSLGADDGSASHKPDEPVFPEALENRVRELIEAEIQQELGDQPAAQVLAMAGGASGGDLLFHEICRARGIATQMFLPLPKPQHIGTYVAPAGSRWVTRFHSLYRQLVPAGETDGSASSGVRVFAESADLPRWLQSLEGYNVGRRSALWMLQHAQNMANGVDNDAEITMIALHPNRPNEGRHGFGGIKDAIRLAQMHGVSVRMIPMPQLRAKAGTGDTGEPPAAAAPAGPARSTAREAADSIVAGGRAAARASARSSG